MKNNFAPFYVGQKVVYVTGIGMPKGSIHVVTELFQADCGCWVIGINGVPINKMTLPGPGHVWKCGACGKTHGGLALSAPITGWNPASFRPLEQQKFPLMTFEKIVEKETTEILINN